MNDKASTIEELKELKKSWIESHLLWVEQGYSESQYIVDTDEAIKQIVNSNVLTDDEIQRAVDEAYDEMSKVCDPGLWNLFINGPQEHWDLLGKLSFDNPQ